MADPVSDLKNAVSAHFDAAVLRPVKAAVGAAQTYGGPMVDTLKNMVAPSRDAAPKRRTTDIYLPPAPRRRKKAAR